MRSVVTSLRNLALGLGFASAMAFAPIDLSAFDACAASLSCGGYNVECQCSGPESGVCSMNSGSVTCSCFGFHTQQCSCTDGCEEVILD